jgi:peptidyl-prolyl cis-trans isomerase C
MTARRTPTVALWVLLALFGVVGSCRKQARQPPGTAAPSASAPGGLSPELARQVLAKVDGRTITLGDYAATLDRMDRFERLRYQTPERRRKLLDEMIKVDLLAEEARRRGLDRQPETVARVRQVMRDELIDRLRQSLPGPAEIPEAEVRAYYDQHRDEFRWPERRRVAHILLADRALAATVLAKALSATPAQWGELVAKHSLDRSGEAGETAAPELAGDLGLVTPPGDSRGSNARVPEPLRKAVFEVEKLGGVSDHLVEADGKLHIVRMTGKTDGRERSYADAERAIRVTLADARLRQAEQDLEQRLREKYPVKIDDQALAKVRVSGPTDGGTER